MAALGFILVSDSSPAISTQSEELQPVFPDLVTGLARDGGDQALQVVALEVCNPTAVTADQ